MKHKLLNPLRLLMVAICMLGLAAEGQEVMVGPVKYQLDPTTHTAKVIQSHEQITQETVEIVPTITYEGDEYTVNEIDQYSLCAPGSGDHNTFKQITIPETIKKIGEGAFLDCNQLESIVIPNSVEMIQQFAFQFCSNLKSCKLSENITVIPGGLFWGCSSLEEIEIPNSVTHFCKELEQIMENGFEDEDLNYASDPLFVYMGQNAFMDCVNLKRVILPKSITNIPLATFQNCINLKTIEIPGTVSWIGHGAFSLCHLNELEIPNSVSIWGDSFFTDVSTYVKSYSTNPGFYFYATADCPLFVPKNMLGLYTNVYPWNTFAEIKEATPVELEGEWRTFCAYEDLDFSGVEGLEAYIATEYQDGKVLMEPIEQVPAGTGVVLKGAPGFYEIPYPDQDEALEPVDNLLVGLNYGERIQAETEDGQCNLFFNDATEMASLFYGPFMDSERAPRLNAEGEQPMFAPADGARLPYHRAYLQLPASEAGKTVEMVFGSLTGIEEVEAQPQTDGNIYNLQGQRVVNPGPGIYIQNGRKFIVR